MSRITRRVLAVAATFVIAVGLASPATAAQPSAAPSLTIPQCVKQLMKTGDYTRREAREFCRISMANQAAAARPGGGAATPINSAFSTAPGRPGARPYDPTIDGKATSWGKVNERASEGNAMAIDLMEALPGRFNSPNSALINSIGNRLIISCSSDQALQQFRGWVGRAEDMHWLTPVTGSRAYWTTWDIPQSTRDSILAYVDPNGCTISEGWLMGFVLSTPTAPNAAAVTDALSRMPVPFKPYTGGNMVMYGGPLLTAAQMSDIAAIITPVFGGAPKITATSPA